ncbi:13511_t:CDS:2 [Gigaspora rosea]|nr:13511_t:CDS:2 [Gigaspora rosea]
MIFIIFWKYTVIAEINHVGQYWKKDTGLTTKFITTPISIPTTASETTSSVPLITTPLKIKVTFENPLMQWTFPIDIGTPPQNLNILIDVTTNLLWVTSELCTNPFGDACYNRTTNFFNTSFTNTITSDDEEFKFKYIQRELISIWVNDTIKFNNQIFEEMQIGLPKDVNGSENFVIPDTVSGQIGIMPYQNYKLDRFAVKSNRRNCSFYEQRKGWYRGTITLGGIDSEYIKGSNENNVTYQLLPQPMEANQQFTVNVTNIYINNKPINLSGLIWFDSGIQNIQLDDNSASIIINNLPGGNYSNGIGTTNCNISTTFDLSFEIANKKWRLPSSVISKNGINGTNKCGSIITSGAKDIGSWIFGSAFLTNYYIVFDQAKSQFGIATRNDINYGPDAPVINEISFNSFKKCHFIEPEAEAAHIIQNIIISPNPVTAASTAEFTISLSTANFTFRSDTFMKIDVMANIEYYGFNSTLFCNNPDNSDCPKNDINKTLTLSIKNGGLKFDIAADCLEADVGIPTSVT